MKVYAFASSPNCWKVLAVARELSLRVETVSVDLFKGEAKTRGFLAKNPNGRVPVLEHEGLVLWESNAILAYLAAQQPIPSLLPSRPRERAEVDRWLYWESTTLSPAVWKVGFEKILKPIMNQPVDTALVAAGTTEFASAAKLLDGALAGKDYLAGKLSIADFAMGPFLSLAAGPCDLDTTPYRSLSAWMARMSARESVRQTMAEAEEAMRATGSRLHAAPQ
jgi:glutathione S-transferase